MDNHFERNIQKPVGIYAVCLAVILAHGGIQFLYYYRDFMLLEGDIPFTITFISLFLLGFNVATAIWAIYGDNLSRICLLIFDSLNVLWFVFLVVISIAYSETQNLEFLKIITIIFRPLVISIIVLCICWYFFTKSEVVAYYKHISKSEE